MKSIMLLAVGTVLLFLTGCETTKEISITENGSGTLVTITDMSSMIGLAKMSKGEELEKLEDKAIDTSISLALMADSIPGLTAEEKALVKTGTLGFTMDVENDKFITRLEFPFTHPGQIGHLDKLSSKVVEQVLKDKVDKGEGKSDLPPSGDFPDATIDTYFSYTYAKGLIERKLDKDKYAGVNDDEEMKALKNMTSMGLGHARIIINLPSPVKKAEGKNVTVSDDKRKVTITSSTEDFFEEGTDLEFRIEY